MQKTSHLKDVERNPKIQCFPRPLQRTMKMPIDDSPHWKRVGHGCCPDRPSQQAGVILHTMTSITLGKPKSWGVKM